MAAGATPVGLIFPYYNSSSQLDIQQSATNAADTVQYYNKTLNIPIHYWIIDNEPQSATHGGFIPHGAAVSTGAAYGAYFTPMYNAMKAVDSTIQIGGPVISFPIYFNSLTSENSTLTYAQNYITSFLQASPNVDFLDFHTYGNCSSLPSETLDSQDLLTTPAYYSTYINDFRKWATAVNSSYATIPIEVGEWNIDACGSSARFDTRAYQGFNTVWGASVLGNILSSGGISLEFTSKSYALSLVVSDPRAIGVPSGLSVDETMPIYHAIGMFTGENLNGFRHFGTDIVSSNTNISNVDVFASYNPDNIVVVNKDPTTTYTGTLFNITGVTNGYVNVWKTDNNSPFSAPTAQSSVNITNGQFNYSLEPYTVYTFIIYPTFSATSVINSRFEDDTHPFAPTYSPNITLRGNRDSSVTNVQVNSSTEVSYPTSNTWEANVSLNTGTNTFTIIGSDNNRSILNSTEISVKRYKIGDILGHNKEDLADLSAFATDYGHNGNQIQNQLTDLNGDGKVDLTDFSIFASNWEK